MSLRQATRTRPHLPLRPPISLSPRRGAKSTRNSPPRGAGTPPPKLGLRRGSLSAKLTRDIDSWAEARNVDDGKWPARPSWRDIDDLAHPPRVVQRVKLVHSEADDPGHIYVPNGPRKPISTVASPFFHLRVMPSMRGDAAARLAQSAADGGAIKISMLPIATKTGVSKLAVERKHARGRFLKAAGLVLNHTSGRLPVTCGWAYTVVLNARTHNVPFAELCEAIEAAFARCGEDKDAVEGGRPKISESKQMLRREAAPPSPTTSRDTPTASGSGKIMLKAKAPIILRSKTPLVRRGTLSPPAK